MIGQTISHYRVTERLGSGGMGVVYAGEDLRLQRPVALKFVPEELARDRQALERLRVEARAASALNHANICTIYSVDEYEHQPFIVMELLKGHTLREKLVSGPLRVSQILEIGIQASDALDAAHTRGIVHRDIKPANLFITDRHQVKILDFGVAKVTERPDPLMTKAGTLSATAQLTPGGVALGTVAYMSPEQATGEPIDGRTDLFSLGVVLYECATGRHPFTGKTSAVILSAILNKAPVAPTLLNPEVPLRLQEVILNCLEKDPELRYQAAAGLRADLKRVKRDLESGQSGIVAVSRPSTQVRPSDVPAAAPADEESGSRPASAPMPHVRSAGRRIATGAAGLAAVTLLAAGGYALWQATRSEREAPAAAGTAVAEATASDPGALEAARASLDRHDYRTALAQAAAILQRAPADADAADIWNAARSAIADLENALAEADRRLEAGDVAAASAALERARSIDPTAPRLSELSAQLVRLRNRSRTAPSTPPAAPRPEPQPQTPPATRPQAETPRSTPPRQEPAGRVEPPVAGPVSATGATALPAAPATTAPRSEPPRQGAGAARAPDTPAAAPTTPPPNEPARADSSDLAATPAPPPATEPDATAPATAPTPSPSATPPASEDADAAIRRVVATYARAIETKDLALFRTVKPNLTAEEARRLADSFQAVPSQQVEATVLAIDRQGPTATVRVRQRNTIMTAGRPQTNDTQLTMTLVLASGSWVIDRIGQ